MIAFDKADKILLPNFHFGFFIYEEIICIKNNDKYHRNYCYFQLKNNTVLIIFFDETYKCDN